MGPCTSSWTPPSPPCSMATHTAMKKEIVIETSMEINTNLVLKRPTHVYYLTDEVLAVGSAYSYQNICDPISVTPASWFGGHQPSHDATSVYERISHTSLTKITQYVVESSPKQELKTWLHFSRCSQAVRPQGILQLHCSRTCWFLPRLKKLWKGSEVVCSHYKTLFHSPNTQQTEAPSSRPAPSPVSKESMTSQRHSGFSLDAAARLIHSARLAPCLNRYRRSGANR